MLTTRQVHAHQGKPRMGSMKFLIAVPYFQYDMNPRERAMPEGTDRNETTLHHTDNLVPDRLHKPRLPLTISED